MKQDSRAPIADVCLILEGTYPYVTGGVSTWTHDLITAESELTFALVTILPRGADRTLRYSLPENVVHQKDIVIQELPEGDEDLPGADALLAKLEAPLMRLQSRGGLPDLRPILDLLGPRRSMIGQKALLDSPEAWRLLVRMYNVSVPQSSFLDFFWTWRFLLSSLYSVLLPELPRARVYHAVSTGYAGLIAARARIETGRPAIVTEHGMYTNERRIEMATASWLHDFEPDSLMVEKPRRTLKSLWIDSFVGYSHACYEACDPIITLYEGNQQFQLQDGAPPDRLRIVPNGVEYERFAAIVRDPAPRPPTIALIGRVVPIKDVKTFIRACAILLDSVAELQALILGPTDEDEAYFEECRAMVRHLELERTVFFAGRVRLDAYLGKIDVLVLTSISEAQPLVILEAGAAGIPSVTTDVGACREMILGPRLEEPPLGPAGAVTPLCNPTATARAVARLLTDPEWYGRASRAIRERVRLSYDKSAVARTYRELYVSLRDAPDSLLEAS